MFQNVNKLGTLTILVKWHFLDNVFEKKYFFTQYGIILNLYSIWSKKKLLKLLENYKL